MKNDNLESSKSVCLIYCPLPYNGQGPAQSCVSIVENIPSSDFYKTLLLPRYIRTINSSVHAKQTIPFPVRYMPWRTIVKLAGPTLNNGFLRAVKSVESKRSVAYFWPTPPASLVQRTRERHFLTVREMTNTFRGTAKKILDQAYENIALTPSHGITEESVDCERAELALHDYIFASNSLVEASLLEAGVEPSRIIQSSYGWLPSRFVIGKRLTIKDRFRALFVGTIGVGKGVPDLLAAWKRSGVRGELVLAGRVEKAIEPLLRPYVASGSVSLLGFVYDVGALYSSADIFVFPSLTEGGPQVTYEAAGCGLPIITTPMGAGRVIQDDVNGLVVQPNDIEGLADAIARLADSSDLRERYSHQVAIDAQQFTYEKIGLARSEQLKTLLEQRSTLGQ